MIRPCKRSVLGNGHGKKSVPQGSPWWQPGRSELCWLCIGFVALKGPQKKKCAARISLVAVMEIRALSVVYNENTTINLWGIILVDLEVANNGLG